MSETRSTSSKSAGKAADNGEDAGFKLPDPAAVGRSMADIAERSQRIVSEWLKRQGEEEHAVDPLNIGSAFLEMTAKLMTNPAHLMKAQLGFWQDYMTLWQNTARRMMGIETEPVIDTPSSDRRFKDDAWKENEVFDFIKQSYLLSARYVQDVVQHVDGLDKKTAQKVDFYARQFCDAMSPSNFLLTNPEVLRKTAETGGENLLKGLNNLLGDLERGKGKLHIKMTDMEAFRVGDNIGVSPGKVIYQNELMQLIQYSPATETVLKRPLLIGPPWINKFYILDLRPRNSFVRYAVSQGHTVFVISWVNPDEKLSEKGFEDYMHQGYLAALDAIEKATGEKEVNAIGYCLGGTLLASTLAYMAAMKDDRIKSATFFVALTDFEEAGELGVFIDEEQLTSLEDKMNQPRLPGRQRDGDDLQHAARQRPDLVVRGEQLSVGERPIPVRPAVLERGFDADAGADAQLLSAENVPGEPAVAARRHRAVGRADRPAQDQGAGVFPVHARGPHRAVEVHLQGHAVARRAEAVRAGGERAYRRRGESAGGRQVQPLDQRSAAAGPGCLVQGSHRDCRVVVAGLAALGFVAGQRTRAGAGAGRWQAEADRGRTRELCEGAVELIGATDRERLREGRAMSGLFGDRVVDKVYICKLRISMA